MLTVQDEKLLWSRVLNEAGDWFYYFVITILIFDLSSSPLVLGILAIMYTIPGAFLSQLISKLAYVLGARKTVIISDIGRALSLVVMIMTENIWLVLLAVFIEQVLSIGSGLAIHTSTVQLVRQDNLTDFNKWRKFFSSFARLLILPLYIVVFSHVEPRFVLWIDVVLTILSVLLYLAIQFPNRHPSAEQIKQPDAPKQVIPKLILVILAVFAAMTLIRAFNDSYGILYISHVVTKDVNNWFAVLTFIVTVADMVGSYVSKRVVDSVMENAYRRWVTLASVSMIIIFAGMAIFNNIYVYFFLMAIGRLIVVIYELVSLRMMQDYMGNRVQSALAWQSTFVDGAALLNASLGALLIEYVDVRGYLLLIAVGLLLMCAFAYRKMRLVDKI